MQTTSIACSSYFCSRSQIAANSPMSSKGKGGKGHGNWVKEHGPKLLELFEEAVLKYAEEVLEMSKEDCTGTPLENALNKFSPNHMVCVERVETIDAAGSKVLIPGNAHVLAPNCEVPPGIDGFPGATVLHPMGTNQWLPPVGSCFLTACLRACSITTVIVVDVDLLHGGFDEQPILSKAFVIMSVLCMGLELWSAAQNLKLKQTVWYHPWEHLSSLPVTWSFDAICHAVYAFTAEIALRFLGLPHAFLAAPKDSFDAAKRLPGCRMPCPILANVSRTARDFELDGGLRSSITKVLLEDTVMLAMKIFLVWGYVKNNHLNGALLLCTAVAVLSSFWTLCWVLRYLSALLRYETEMEDHIRAGDPLDVRGRQGDLRAVAEK